MKERIKVALRIVALTLLMVFICNAHDTLNPKLKDIELNTHIDDIQHVTGTYFVQQTHKRCLIIPLVVHLVNENCNTEIQNQTKS